MEKENRDGCVSNFLRGEEWELAVCSLAGLHGTATVKMPVSLSEAALGEFCNRTWAPRVDLARDIAGEMRVRLTQQSPRVYRGVGCGLIGETLTMSQELLFCKMKQHQRSSAGLANQRAEVQ